LGVTRLPLALLEKVGTKVLGKIAEKAGKK
jgi:hypothetical protein